MSVDLLRLSEMERTGTAAQGGGGCWRGNNTATDGGGEIILDNSNSMVSR